jgi:hypothetical protein
MKKILVVLTLIFMAMACSSDDEKDEIGTGDNTSVIVEQWVMPYMENVILGYYDGNSCKILQEIGTLKISKPTKEIIINKDVTDIYLFFDYYDQMKEKTISYRVKEKYTIKKNNVNSFTVVKTDYIEIEKNDKAQYPHN